MTRLHLLNSVSLRTAAEEALEDLEEVAREASRPGWNGYDAQPVDLDAYEHGRAFIQSLPTTVPKPEVGVDPDGEISVDRLFGKALTLSVSIGRRGRLTFASLLGDRVVQGTDWLHAGIPATILDELTMVAAEARRAGLLAKPTS